MAFFIGCQARCQTAFGRQDFKIAFRRSRLLTSFGLTEPCSSRSLGPSAERGVVTTATNRLQGRTPAAALKEALGLDALPEIGGAEPVDEAPLTPAA